MIRILRYISILLVSILSLLSVVAQDVVTDSLLVSDEELERWLEEYGTEITDSLESDTIKNNNDTIETTSVADNELEKLLEEFAVGKTDSIKSIESTSTAISDTTDKVKVMTEEVEQMIVKAEPVELIDTLSTQYILNKVDSQLIAMGNTIVNPLFIDWVIGVPGAVSMSLKDEDSVVVRLRKDVKDHIRVTSPELYSYHVSQLPELSELKGSRLNTDVKDEMRLNLDSIRMHREEKLDVWAPKLSRWTNGAKFQVHASQNYISPNWYKGGESNIAGNLYALGFFNYDNKKGLQWDTKVEWKLGVNSSSSDTLRWLRVNEDLFRINSKVGLKAFKNFYYTAEIDFQTQLFNTYKSNSNIRTSGPFSPIRTNFSLGMDYKYKDMISLFVSPVSYKLVYVSDTSYRYGVLPSENIPNQIGLSDGKRKSNQLGALIRFDFNHDFNESIGMEIKFNMFGNYVGKVKGIEVGCEVIGNFKINRYFTAKAVLYPRYDSTVLPPEGKKNTIQFWELISLGFTYKI